MKKISAVIIVLLFSLVLFSCDEKLPIKKTIATTLFPYYDMAKHLVGEEYDVKLVLNPGQDAHSYDPSVEDVLEIRQSTLFVLTGRDVETWASGVLEQLTEENHVLEILDDKRIHLESVHEIHDEDHHHNHSHSDFDTHVWTNLEYSKYIIEDICDALIKIDPVNKTMYQINMLKYQNKLDEYINKIAQIKEKAVRNEIFFGAPFSFLYLFDQFEFDVVSAYDTCSMEVDPSISIIIDMNKQIKEKNIPVIYVKELMADTAMAEAIIKDTNAEILVLHSGHNVNFLDFNRGITYFEIIEQNIKNLERVLL